MDVDLPITKQPPSLLSPKKRCHLASNRGDQTRWSLVTTSNQDQISEGHGPWQANHP